MRSATFQGGGLLAYALAATYISRTYGSHGQGYFAGLRAIIDFAVSIALFGVPQALSYYAGKKKEAVTSLVSLAIVYSLVLLPLIFASLQLAKWVGSQMVQGFGVIQLIGCSTAASLLTCHGLLRGLALGVMPSDKFGMVSSAFQFSLLPILLVLYGWPSWVILPAYSAAALMAASFAFFQLWLFARGVTHRIGFLEGWKWLRCEARGFLGFSAYSFVPNVAGTALPLVTFDALQRHQSQSEVGLFSVAFLVASALNAPLGIAVPLLYQRWLHACPSKRRAELIRLLLLSSPVVLVGAALLCLLGPYLMPLVFGAEFKGAVSPTQHLVGSFIVVVFVRVGGAMLTALGRPGDVGLASVGKLLAVAIGVQWTAPLGLTAVADVWIVGDVIALLITVRTLDRAFKSQALEKVQSMSAPSTGLNS